MKKMQGVYTALITPFKEERVDEEGLRVLIQRQLNHVDGIVVLGSTGEAPTLSDAEKIQVIKCAREAVKDIKLVVGAGTNCTHKTIEFCKVAEELGADILMISPPYYNKPTQRGLIQHFEEILKSVKTPILIYNNPGRTCVNLEPQTLKTIAQNPQICGVKEACGNISQMQEIIEIITKERPDFSVLSGDDSLTFSLMALGGDGVVSVASNLVPRSIKELTSHLLKGNFIEAREIHYSLATLFNGLFIETNPIPIKKALQFVNLPSGDPRLPLCTMEAKNSQKLLTLLESYRNLQ